MKRGYIFFLIILLLTSCSSDDAKKPNKQENVTLISKPFSTALFYSGIIQPIKTVVVTSPAEGVIQDIAFHYGDKVEKDKLLFNIASEKFLTDYKNALLQYIKTKNEFNTAKSQLTQSRFLHKNELISDDEFKSKETAFYHSQLALLQAKESLTVMIKQTNMHRFNLDELNIENIDKITQALNNHSDSQKLRISAPASGFVLLPVKNDGEGDAKKMSKGDQIKQGDVLALIGDLSGLMIRVNVNEFNINQLQVGQKVKVTGSAFPEVILHGCISGIDRQGQATSGGIPMFPVEIIVPKLDPNLHKQIHVGMSAKVEINIESEPQLTVPIAAVFEKNGQAFVNAKDKKGKIREVPVKVGPTTADSVAIESSLKAGDVVVVG